MAHTLVALFGDVACWDWVILCAVGRARQWVLRDRDGTHVKGTRPRQQHLAAQSAGGDLEDMGLKLGGGNGK